MQIKNNVYQENGVTEYWVVAPFNELLFQYVLHQDHYLPPQIVLNDEVVASVVFPQLRTQLSATFE